MFQNQAKSQSQGQDAPKPAQQAQLAPKPQTQNSSRAQRFATRDQNPPNPTSIVMPAQSSTPSRNLRLAHGKPIKPRPTQNGIATLAAQFTRGPMGAPRPTRFNQQTISDPQNSRGITIVGNSSVIDAIENITRPVAFAVR
jgi:hypothetical protein